jgi:hypothetical protein
MIPITSGSSSGGIVPTWMTATLMLMTVTIGTTGSRSVASLTSTRTRTSSATSSTSSSSTGSVDGTKELIQNHTERIIVLLDGLDSVILLVWRQD